MPWYYCPGEELHSIILIAFSFLPGAGQPDFSSIHTENGSWTELWLHFSYFALTTHQHNTKSKNNYFDNVQTARYRCSSHTLRLLSPSNVVRRRRVRLLVNLVDSGKSFFFSERKNADRIRQKEDEKSIRSLVVRVFSLEDAYLYSQNVSSFMPWDSTSGWRSSFSFTVHKLKRRDQWFPQEIMGSELERGAHRVLNNYKSFPPLELSWAEYKKLCSYFRILHKKTHIWLVFIFEMPK